MAHRPQLVRGDLRIQVWACNSEHVRGIELGEKGWEMTDLLSKVVDVLVAHPGLAAGIGVGVLFLLIAWAVVSTSYKYR